MTETEVSCRSRFRTAQPNRNRSRRLLRGLLLGAYVVDVRGRGRESRLDDDSGAANGGREERPLGSSPERPGRRRLIGVGLPFTGCPGTASVNSNRIGQQFATTRQWWAEPYHPGFSAGADKGPFRQNAALQARRAHNRRVLN